MKRHSVYVVQSEVITGYGTGRKACADGLFSGKHAFRKLTRFSASQFGITHAATVPDGFYDPDRETLSFALMRRLAEMVPVPASTRLFFAATLGEIEKLEEASCWTGDLLFRKTLELFHLSQGGLFSNSCASGNLALACAASSIASGRCETALAAGCDIVSEFVLAGFASVRAMSRTLPRPYDRNRDGLGLGDAGGAVLLASEEAVEKYGWIPLARISGWGLGSDARHMAAPDPEGGGMIRAIRHALGENGFTGVGAVIGHGTGTLLNDAMEIAVMNSLSDGAVPLVSVKGGTGHVLAAAGLVQLAMACTMLERKQIFPQTGLTEPDPAARFPIPDKIIPLAFPRILSLNAGFGGSNAVIAVEEP